MAPAIAAVARAAPPALAAAAGGNSCRVAFTSCAIVAFACASSPTIGIVIGPPAVSGSVIWRTLSVLNAFTTFALGWSDWMSSAFDAAFAGLS
jgi:hypothetical protein